MMGQVIDGRKIANELRGGVAREINDPRAAGSDCGLTTIRVGEELSSVAYPSRLAKIDNELGVRSPRCGLRQDLVSTRMVGRCDRAGHR